MERILQQVVAEQRLKHVRRVVLCGCGGGGWGSSGVGVGQQQPLRRVTNVGDFIGILPPVFICLKEVLAGATLDSSGTIFLSSEAWKDSPQVFKADLIAEYEQLMGAALLTNANRNADGFGKFKKFPVYGRGAEARVAERNADDTLLRKDVAMHLEALQKYHTMIQTSNLKDAGDARINQKQLSALAGLDLNATFPPSYTFREDVADRRSPSGGGRCRFVLTILIFAFKTMDFELNTIHFGLKMMIL